MPMANLAIAIPNTTIAIPGAQPREKGALVREMLARVVGVRIGGCGAITAGGC